VPKVRKTRIIEFAFPTTTRMTGATRMTGDFLPRFFGLKVACVFRSNLGSQVEQMQLALSLDDPLSTTAVNPTLVPFDQLQRGCMLLLEFLMRCGRFVEHAFQFPDSQLGNAQKSLALGQIVGDFRVAVHRVGRCP